MDEEGEGEGEDEPDRRILVFATRRNIELLCKSDVWFVDGIFKTSLTIFAQIFTVMGLQRRAGNTESIVVPFAYTLLSGNKKSMYLEMPFATVS